MLKKNRERQWANPEKKTLQTNGQTDKAEFIGTPGIQFQRVLWSSNKITKTEYGFTKAFWILTERTKNIFLPAKVGLFFLPLLAQKQELFFGLIKKRNSKQIKIGEKDVFYS